MYPISRRYEHKHPTSNKSPSPTVRTQKDTSCYMPLLENAQLNTLLWNASTSWLVELVINIHEIRPFSTLIGQTDLGMEAGERGSTCKASEADGQKESVISGILWDWKNCFTEKKDLSA